MYLSEKKKKTCVTLIDVHISTMLTDKDKDIYIYNFNCLM